MSQNKKDTPDRLPTPGFSELPRGAVVNKRYEVIETFETHPHENTYLVFDASTQKQYLLLEAADPQRYRRERQVIEANLHHPALVEVYDEFQIKYGDFPRAYLVLEFPLDLISPGNYREMQILQWGVQLADALACLHDHQIAHGNIQPASLYLSNHQIKLGGYSNIARWSPELGVRDVAQLAQTLEQLTIRREQTTPVFSSAVAQVLQRAREQQYPDAHTFQADWQPVVDARRHPARITPVVGRLSDVGRRRELDEDAVLTVEITQFAQADRPVIGLYAVADGMGGASAGEVASQMVTDTLAREVTQKVLTPRLAIPEAKLDYGEILQAAIQQANLDVLNARTHAQTDMGSTVVAALLVGDHAHIANVGDSRAYLITPTQINQITKDHSLVQALVERGAIAPEDMRVHPQRNYILRNIGDKAPLQVDLYDVTLQPGQNLLLCCDGLWEMMPDEQIHTIVNQHTNPQDACRALIQAANDNGGDDNITCVVVRLESA